MRSHLLRLLRLYFFLAVYTLSSFRSRSFVALVVADGSSQMCSLTACTSACHLMFRFMFIASLPGRSDGDATFRSSAIPIHDTVQSFSVHVHVLLFTCTCSYSSCIPVF